MEDIVNSRARARLSQGWKTGQLLRIGDPFHSREEAMSPWTAEGTDAGLLLEYIANYNEKYPTPKEIQTEDFNDVLKPSEEVIADAWKLCGPFLDEKKEDLKFSDLELIFKDLKSLFESRGFIINWKELEKQSLDETINALAMASPFTLEEKQVLLEAENLNVRKNKIADILRTYTYDVFDNTTLQ